MKGRDEFEAFAALQNIGVASAELRQADGNALLAGPESMLAPVDAIDGQ
ncbi:hypothetical protein [Paenarthrobacter nicotinovorans]|nr:hypothetical protein [Paenarthrobacter nicotinovorans]